MDEKWNKYAVAAIGTYTMVHREGTGCSQEQKAVVDMAGPLHGKGVRTWQKTLERTPSHGGVLTEREKATSVWFLLQTNLS